MPRDKQYYAMLFENALSQFTQNEQSILQDFYNHLNQITSSILGAFSNISSGKIPPQQDLAMSLFLASWNLVPTAGGYISKALTMGANAYEEATAKRLSSVLGNFNHKDETAEIFSRQAVIYHAARILNNELENSTFEGIVTHLKATAKAIIAFCLPKKINLTPAREALMTELLVQLTQSLDSAINAYEQNEFALEQLGDYLAQQLVVVNNAPLTPHFAFTGAFHHLAQESRYHIALDALRLSLLAAEDKALIASYAKQWGYIVGKEESFFYQFENNNRCIILANQEIVFCLFRGAPDQIGELLSTLNMTKKSIEGIGEVHRGFANALDALWDKNDGLGDRLSYHAKFPPKRFLFIGHSTGAALAILAAARFYHQYEKHRDKLTVFTYGQSRVGKNLSEEFGRNVYRFIHPDDPIPFMPAEVLGYEHIGITYSLPDVTQIFNWENVSPIAPSIFAVKREAHSLKAYQTRLIEHARSHSHAALPDYLKTYSGSASVLDSLGDIVFREAFISEPMTKQLDILRSFTQAIIKELCQTGGIGFKHSIKNSFAHIDALAQYYSKQKNLALIIEAERLGIWLKLAADQKQHKDAFKDIFNTVNTTSDDDSLFYKQLIKIESNAQTVLGDKSLAPLLLINVLQQMSNFSQKAESLRRVLATQPLTHYLVQIEVLNLLGLIAKEKKDIWLVLFGEKEAIDLTRWLHNTLPVAPEDKKTHVDDYLQQWLIQLQTVQDEPILQELIASYKAAGNPENLLLPALETVCRNLNVNPKVRLHALQVKQKIQLLPHVKETVQKGLPQQPSDIHPSALRILTYHDHMELGELALLAEENALAKSAFNQAYQLLKMILPSARQDARAELEAHQAKVTSKIIALLWQDLEAKVHPWDKSIIYQEILRYDDSNHAALRELSKLGLGDWCDFATHLPSIGTQLDIKDVKKYLDDPEDAVLLQTPFNGTWILNKDAVTAFDKRTSIRNSMHAVAQVGGFFIKENPGLVGLAFAAWALSRWVFLGLPNTSQESGFVPVQPAKVLRKGQDPIVVQLSPAIAGDNVQELLEKNPDPESLKQLDPSHFSALMIMSILLNMGDARDANFIKVAGLKQLISIDNDHVFIRDEIESGFLGSQVIVKNLVFCLAQMQDAVDDKIIHHLTHPSFAPLSRIRAWLYSMHHYNQMLTCVFHESEHKALFERPKENAQVVLPVFFDSQAILQPATKLFTICHELKKSSTITHQALFKVTRKNLAKAYESVFDKNQSKTLLQRMQAIGGLTGISLSTPGKVIKHNIGKSVKTHEQFKYAQAKPKEILQLLRDIDKDENLLDMLLEEIAAGNITTFAREEAIQELVLARLNEKHYSNPNFTLLIHQALLNAISPTIKSLTFKSNTYLTDADLLSLIERLPALTHIILMSCPNIKGTFPRSVDLANILPEINWLEPWLLQVGQKTLDVQNCYSVTPEFLSLLDALDKQNSQFTVSFFSEEYRYPSDQHNDIAIAQPQWGLLIPPLVPLFSSPKVIATLEGHKDRVTALAVLPDGSIISGSEDTTLKHWQRKADGWVCVATLEGNKHLVTNLAVLPDGSIISSRRYMFGGHEIHTLEHWQHKAGIWTCVSTLEGLKARINALAVLPDGTILGGSGDNTLKHWQLKTGIWTCISTLEGHKANVNTLVVLPDGSVISGSSDYTIKHWWRRADKWDCVATLKGHVSHVCALAVLPDGGIVSASIRGPIKHWQRKADTWTCVSSFGHNDEIHALAVLPDGGIISAARGYTIKYWQRKTDKWVCKKILKEPHYMIYALAVLPDGSIISGGVLPPGSRSDYNQVLKHWQMFTSGPKPEIPSKRERFLYNATQLLQRGFLYPAQVPQLFPKDLITLDVSNTRITDALLHDILQHCPCLTLENMQIENCGWLSEKNHLLHRLKQQSCQSAVIFENMPFNDAALLAALIEFPVVRELTIKSCPNFQGQLLEALQAHGIQKLIMIDCLGLDIFAIDAFEIHAQTSLVLDISRAISPHQQHVLACSYPANRHFLINPLVASPAVLLQTLSEDPNYSIKALAVLPDGSIMGGLNDIIKHWQRRIDIWVCVATLVRHKGDIRALAVLPDGSILSGSSDKTIKHWQYKVDKWVCIETLEGHQLGIDALVVLPDGSFISSSRDTLKHWQHKVDMWICITTLEGYQKNDCSGSGNLLAVLPNGSIISRTDGLLLSRLKNWHCNKGIWGWCFATLEEYYGIGALAVLPDGSIISACGCEIRHWQVKGLLCVCIAKLEGHNSEVTSLAVLSDGSFISGSSDKTIKHWQYKVDKWVCIETLEGHNYGGIYALAVLPDGSIVSSSEDKTLKHWQMFTSAPISNMTTEHERLLHNAMQLLQRGFLHPTHVPKLFPKDLTELDVSNTRISDVLLKAILLQCPQLTQIKADNCIWLTKEGRDLIAKRVISHTQVMALSQWTIASNAQDAQVNHGCSMVMNMDNSYK